MDCVKRRFEAAVESFCCSGWEELLEPLAPLDAGSLQYDGKNGKLTFDSGRILKGRFEAFNSSFEALLAEQGGFSAPDSVLRARLRSTIGSKLVPAVQRFHDAHASTTFSKKHQQEYLRYAAPVVQEKIDALL